MEKGELMSELTGTDDYNRITGTMPGFLEIGPVVQIIDIENKKVKRFYSSGNKEEFDLEINKGEKCE